MSLNLPQTKKSLGQHWLTDQTCLQDICDAANLAPTDVVLEIGPGPGTLTQKLVQQAKQVIAVEFDEWLANNLPHKVIASNLQVINQDILKFDLTTLPPGYKVVANIPYYLTSNLLRVLSESPNPPQTIVLLIQKEVAERVAAKPGSMSLLSVTTQWFYQPQLHQVVPAYLFTPPPKIDSQILSLVRRPAPIVKNVDTNQLFKVVRAGFSQRRKTLLNSLSAGLHQDKTEVDQAIKTANLDPKSRPQELSLTDWCALQKATQNNT
jgi:16S rRNA (adenine1518-N6/adenine1519-N6)-dimethyltransferase